MKKTVILLALCMAWTSMAETISGTLEVKSNSLRVKRDDGFKVRFYKGTYATQVALLGERRGVIHIERKGITTAAELNIPRDTHFPDNGEFSLPGSETGQTFDLKGIVKTTTVDGPTVHDWEPCIYYEEEYVCVWERGRRYCYWDEVAYPGEEEVEYFMRTRTRDLKLHFNGSSAMNFSGQRQSRNKIYTYRGICR